MRIPGSSISMGLCLSLFAGELLAQSECETDADCAAGMTCEVMGSSGCPGAPDCKPGEDCPEVEPCEPEEFRGCAPGPCESDADCGPDMVCQTTTWESCDGAAGMACDEEGNCEVVVEEPVCETGTDSQCIYRWQQECEADADCGAGFTCEQREAGCDCAVSGGAETDPAVPDEDTAGSEDDAAGSEEPVDEEASEAEAADDAEANPDLVAPDMQECDCGEPETVGYCQAEEVECETDADCPESWTCTAPPQPACGGAAEPPPGEADAEPAEDPAAGGAPSEGGDEAPPEEDPGASDLPAVDEDPDCAVVEGPMMCVPPGGGWVTDSSSGSDDVGTSDPRGEEAGEPTSDDGETEPPTAPEEGDGEDDEEPGDADENGTDDDGAVDDGPADEDEATDDEEDEASDDDEEDGEGGNENGVASDSDGDCSVKAPKRGTPSALWLAGLLGLALFRRRN